MSVLALVRSTPEAAGNDVQAMKQKLVDYWNAVANINASSFGIVKTELKRIDESAEPPAWWNELSGNVKACQGHAQFWIGTIYPSLTRVPQTIITYNTFFGITIRSVIDLMKKVEARTATAADKQAIKDKLGLLVTQLGTSKKQVGAVRTDIKNFTDQLAADHTALSSGAASVTAALKENEKEVQRLTALVEELRAELQSLMDKMTVAQVAMGVSMTIVGVAMFSMGPFGTIGLVIGLIGAVGSAVAWVILLEKAKDKQAEIDRELPKLDKAALQAFALKAIDASVKNLIGNIDTINENITIVADTWAKLETDLSGILTKLNAASDDQWVDIIQKGMDIGAAQEAWKSLAEFAGKLQKVDVAIDPNVRPVKAA